MWAIAASSPSSASSLRAPSPRSSSVSAPQQRDQVADLDRSQLQHPHPAQQRRVDLEARVLGGRPDQRAHPRLDVRQQDVLLRLVEAVDLVDEQQRPAALVGPPSARDLDHLAQLAGSGRGR
nr:hypothetical protein [Nannocystis pusilla]